MFSSFSLIFYFFFQFVSFCRFYFRLYVFPYKVLYPSGHYAVGMQPEAPFYYFFNGLLLFLFAMNLWWFHFIILLIWRVVTGRSTEVEDTREVGTPQVNTRKSPCMQVTYNTKAVCKYEIFLPEKHVIP